MRSRPRSGSNPTFDVLRGGFGFYALGNFLSFVGTWMQMVSMAWLSWEITGSNAKVGFIAMCGGVASVALTPAAGVFADRHHPLLQVRVVQAAAFVHASALYLLVASGLANFVTLAMMSFIGGCVLAFDQPQRFSLIGALVDPERATTAFAINSTTFNAARFLGPTLAGVMIAAGQTTLSFLLNAVSYALFFAVSDARARGIGPASALPAPGSHARGGVGRTALRRRTRRDLGLLVAGFGFGVDVAADTAIVARLRDRGPGFRTGGSGLDSGRGGSGRYGHGPRLDVSRPEPRPSPPFFSGRRVVDRRPDGLGGGRRRPPPPRSRCSWPGPP